MKTAELNEEEDTPLLDQITGDDLQKGDPGSSQRQRLIDGVGLALELPVDFEGEIEYTGEGEDEAPA